MTSPRTSLKGFSTACYSFALELLVDAPTAPGSRIAWFVARNHNTGNLQSNRMLWWHISGAALTVWLTRNWSADQLLAKAHEILSAQRAASNSALVTDVNLPPI